MKKNLRFLAIFCSLAFMITAFSACKGSDSSATDGTSGSQDVSDTSTEEPSGAAITDGYFELTDEGIMQNFYRFKEDGTYYAKFFDGGVTDAGTYVVLDEEMQYISSPGADGEFETGDDETAAAPQVIEITSYLSGETAKLAYDNNALCDINLGGMTSHRTLEHKPDFVYVEADMEVAIPVITLYADNNEGENLTLYHNGSYVDYTGETGDEGTWVISGSNGYALTSENTPGQTGTITVSDDKLTAEYKVGDAVLNLTFSVGEVIAVFTAEGVEAGLPMTVDVRIDVYGNGTAEVVVVIAQIDDEFVVDRGSYAPGFTSFEFALAGKIETEIEEDVLNIPYAADVVIDFMDNETPLTIDTVVSGQIAAAEVTSTFIAEGVETGLPMGVDMRLECRSDNTCGLVMIVEAVGEEFVIDSGTYTVSDGFNFSFNFNAAGSIEGSPNYESATENSIEVEVPYTAQMQLALMGADTDLSIDTVLAGTVVVG